LYFVSPELTVPESNLHDVVRFSISPSSIVLEFKGARIIIIIIVIVIIIITVIIISCSFSSHLS
jgi:hypothetical protein